MRALRLTLLSLALLVSARAANVAALLGGPTPTGGTPVDFILDIQSGSTGDAITTTLLDSSTHGASVSWAYISPRASLSHTKVSEEAWTRWTPLRVGGTLYSTTSRVLHFDLDDAVADAATPIYEGVELQATSDFPAGIENMTVTYVFEFDTDQDPAGLANAGTDLTEFGGDFSYAIPQTTTLGTNSRFLVAHTAQATGALKIPLERTTKYLLTSTLSTTTTTFLATLQDNATGAHLGTTGDVTAGGEISLLKLRDYLGIYGGSIKVAFYAVDYSNVSHPATTSFTVAAPSSLSLSQTANDELTLTFTHKGFLFDVERHNGTSWSTLASNLRAVDYADGEFVGASTYVDTTVTEGLTYKYRLTAKVGSHTSSVSSESNTVTVSNSLSPTAEDNFDSYSDSSSLAASAAWVSSTSDAVVRKPASDGSVYPSGNVTALLYHDTGTYGDDQRAEITIDAATTGGGFDWIGPAVRVQSGSASGYMVVFSSTDLYLLSCASGTVVTLNSDTGMTLTAGNKIAIEATGTGTSTRLKVQIDTGSGWTDKWTDVNPAADIDGGKPGIGGWVLGTTGNRLDDWKGYDLP